MNANTISIIPFPHNLEETGNFYTLHSKNIKISGPKDVNLSSMTCVFNKMLESSGFTMEVSASSDKPSIEVIKTPSVKDFSLTENDSYCLEITPFKITVAANTDSGFFYAFISLVQLIMSYREKLPTLLIQDKSAYEWRGFLLDTARSFYSTDFIKKVIDACAFHKMNVFHWHLTDDQGWRIPIKGYEKLTEIGSSRTGHTNPPAEDGYYDIVTFKKRYYSHEEIKEIVAYAQERFITIVPEIELPGHVSSLLASYPEYGCTKKDYHVENRYGIFDDVLCLGNDKIFKLYSDIFDTVTSLFPGKYIHIGGDECPSTKWQECPECTKRLKAENLTNYSQLQSWATKKMIKIVLDHKRIPIGWDEVIDNNDVVPIDTDLIIQSWRGVEGGEKASSLKHKVIMSPQTHCYLDHKNYPSVEEPGRLGYITLQKTYEYTPVTEKMKKEDSQFIMGGEGTLWTEVLPYSKVSEYLMFPRFCSLAESLWLKEDKKDYERFLNVLDTHKKRLDMLNIIYYDGKDREE